MNHTPMKDSISKYERGKPKGDHQLRGGRRRSQRVRGRHRNIGQNQKRDNRGTRCDAKQLKTHVADAQKLAQIWRYDINLVSSKKK